MKGNQRFDKARLGREQSDKSGDAEGDAEQHRVNEAAEEKFEDSCEPVLSINTTDGEEQLNHDRNPEEGADDGREGRGRLPGEQKSDPDDEHGAEKNKGVGVQRENEVLDVETPFENVENLQNEGEKRNTAEHHWPEILEERAEKEIPPVAPGPELFLRPLFHPG